MADPASLGRSFYRSKRSREFHRSFEDTILLSQPNTKKKKDEKKKVTRQIFSQYLSIFKNIFLSKAERESKKERKKEAEEQPKKRGRPKKNRDISMQSPNLPAYQVEFINHLN